MAHFRASLFLASLGIAWACTDTTAPSNDSIAITPQLTSLVLNGAAQLRAFVTDQNGHAVSSVTILWHSSQPSVISVSDSGLLRSLAPGTATITATAGDASAKVTVAVASSFTALWTAGRVTCGVATTGTPYCRGADDYSQLGGGTAPDQNTFVPVDLSFSSQGSLPFRAVYPDGNTTCALGADSSAWCWGAGLWGDLGVGPAGVLGVPTLQLASPTIPVAGGHRFTQLAKGGGHTCGLTAALAAYCWGENSFGATGDQLAVTYAPAAILGFQFQSLAAGGDNTCGVTPANAAYCWGDNRSGQLGVVTDTPFTAPTAVLGGPYQALSVRPTTCALDPDGTAYCWGINTPYPRPQPVAGGLTFTQVSSVYTHGCGLTTDGSAYCWSASDLTPGRVPAPVSFSGVSAGENFDCGVGADSAAYCWPTSCPAALYPYCGQAETIIPVPGTIKFRSISTTASDGVGCGQAVTDTLYCWGMNSTYSPTPLLITNPQPVPGSAGIGLTPPSSPLCGLAADSTALCWTLDYAGGTDSVTVSASQAVPGGLHYGSFNRDGGRWCGTSGGQVYCADSANTTPAAVPGATGFATVGTDADVTCGLKGSGSAFCWGSNTAGQLGIGFASGWSSRPLPVGGGHLFLGVVVSTDHGCGLATDLTTWCWGGAFRADSLRFPPRQVPGPQLVRGLAAGFDFTCGLTGSGAAYCWGRGLATPTPFEPSEQFQFLSISASNFVPGFGYADICGLTLAGDPVCWTLPATVPAPRRPGAPTARRRTF